MSALKFSSDIAVTVSFGKDTAPLMSIGTCILPKALVARKAFAWAFMSMWCLCSWIWSMSSPIATVSRPIRPATNRLSIRSPIFAFDILSVLSLPSKCSFARSIIAKSVSLLSVYTM